MSDERSFHVGQQAVISRTIVVTVERVTPTGRVTAGGRAFDAKGRERVGKDIYRRALLEPLTPEIQAEMDLVARGRVAASEASAAAEAAAKWVRKNLATWGHTVPEDANVERAEALTAAIQSVLGSAP